MLIEAVTAKMASVLEPCYRLSTADGHRKWNIQPESIVRVGDRAFVKLARSAHGFASLVFHKCPQVPQPVPKGYSLTTSLGYSELVARRNREDQVAQLAKAEASVPALFRGKCVVSAKVQRKTHKEMSELRQSPDVITLKLDGVEDSEGNTQSVDVARPAHTLDDLMVPLADIDSVLKYFQQSGFSAQQQKRKRPDRDGVWHRKDKDGSDVFLKAVKKQGCVKATKKFKTEQEAIEYAGVSEGSSDSDGLDPAHEGDVPDQDVDEPTNEE